MIEPPQRHIVDGISSLAENDAAARLRLWRLEFAESRSISMVWRCGGCAAVGMIVL
jgi:hypothetical protein